MSVEITMTIRKVVTDCAAAEAAIEAVESKAATAGWSTNWDIKRL